MGLTMEQFRTLRVRSDGPICTLQIYRPEANNSINDVLVEEFQRALKQLRDEICVLVVEGLPEVFCFGAISGESSRASRAARPGLRIRRRFTMSGSTRDRAVRQRCACAGQGQCGGMGFIAACDIVLADDTATFSLSELLFGLMPACVLPFLIRRVGHQKAHYMTLMTQPISVQKAEAWGLVDAFRQQQRNAAAQASSASAPSVEESHRAAQELYRRTRRRIDQRKIASVGRQSRRVQ